LAALQMAVLKDFDAGAAARRFGGAAARARAALLSVVPFGKPNWGIVAFGMVNVATASLLSAGSRSAK
jgi:hypothetical protein